jgi:hypothetical protein
MYLLILILVPFLYMFNPLLAMAGLVVAIVTMYVERTGASKKRRSKHVPESSEYTAGYEN